MLRRVVNGLSDTPASCGVCHHATASTPPTVSSPPGESHVVMISFSVFEGRIAASALAGSGSQ